MPYRYTEDLQPFAVDVPLFAGQNSSADSRIVEPGALPLVENGRFYTNGQLQKRFGVAALSMLDTDGNTVAATHTFVSGNTLFAHDGQVLYTYNSVNANWQRIGGFNIGSVYSATIAQTRNDIGEIASAATDDAVCIAWTDNGAVKLSVYLIASGTFAQAATVLAPSGSKPNVVTLNGDFYAAYYDTVASNVKIAKIESANLSDISTVLDDADKEYSTAFGGGSRYYDICVSGAFIYLVVCHTANVLYVNKYDAALVFQADDIRFDAAWGVATQPWCFALSTGTVNYGNARGWVTWLVNTGAVNTFPSPLVAGAVRRIYGGGTDADNVCWAELDSGIQNYLVQVTTVPSTGVMTATGVDWFTNTDCYFASRTFAIDGHAYVWALADFNLQTQLMLIDEQGQCVGRALTNGNAAPSDGVFCSLPNVAADSSLNYYFAARRRAQLKFDANGNVSTTIGATLLNLGYDNPVAQGVNVGGSTYTNGAAPKLFDGTVLTELGFYFYCDTPVLAAIAASGSLSAGVYNYALCYAWYDNQGKLWRSPVILVPAGDSQPNGASAATITTVANDSVSITNISYLQGTDKDDVFIEVYRTRADGTVFYKIGEIDNVDTVDVLTTSYVDSLADSALAGETLYTDGSAPPYMAPPAFAYLTATPNRLYGLSTETNEVWVSNLATETIPAQFLLGQTLTVPTTETSPNCVEVMDGNLYVFSDDAILTTNADGTYLSQTQSVQFAPPRALPVDGGCTAPGSLLRTEQGLWYQSNKGVMLLDRQQSSQFIGEPVKNYTDTIVAATTLPLQQLVRFESAGQSLVYDYVFNRWSINTMIHPATDGARWRNSYVLVSSDGKAKQEVADTFTDDGVYYSRRVVTPWIKAAGINGYARCWRFIVLGTLYAPHTLQVRIAYQYDETFIDTLTIESTEYNPNSIYGDGLGNYGRTSAGVYGQRGAVSYQFKGVMPRQKATAFKFEITDINNSGSGEAMGLTMLSLECGAYLGLARMPASKTTG